MTDARYRSSGLYAGFIPIAMCALGVLALVGGLILLATFREPANLFLVSIGVALFVMFVRSRRLFGVVTADPSGVTIEQDGTIHSFAWRDVASFRTIPFVTPPVYRLAFHSSTLVTYFIPPTSASVNFGFWAWHRSAMAKFIRERLSQVGAA